MFLGLLDPLVRGVDPDPEPSVISISFLFGVLKVNDEVRIQ